MELPIQVIVVLFVALVVGGAIVAFSRTTLDNVQDQLADMKNDPATRDKVVEVVSLDDAALRGLMETCAQREQGAVRTMCFAVFADAVTADIPAMDGTPVLGNIVAETSAAGSGKALRIYYTPGGADSAPPRIEVIGS